MSYTCKVNKSFGEFTFGFRNHKELFDGMEIIQTIPQCGPNGETDLIFKHRVTQQGHSYYSIVCPSADKEYHFGIYNNDSGNLFPKDGGKWVDTWKPDNNGSQQQGGQQQNGGYSPAQQPQVPQPMPQQPPQQVQQPQQQAVQQQPQSGGIPEGIMDTFSNQG